MATIANSSTQTKQASAGVTETLVGNSSWIAKIKYDPASFQLTVTTKEGSEYVHFMVYPMTVDQFLQAPSKGKFYSETIKGKGLSTRAITKTTGKPLRNPAKGPVDTKKDGRKKNGR